MALDYKALARAAYDPSRMQTAYQDEKRRLRQRMTDAYAAQFAPYGSVAASRDPSRYGSIARQFSTAFDPVPEQQGGGGEMQPIAGMPDPSSAQWQDGYFDPSIANKQTDVARSKLRRKRGGSMTGFDLGDFEMEDLLSSGAALRREI